MMHEFDKDVAARAWNRTQICWYGYRVWGCISSKLPLPRLGIDQGLPVRV